MGLTTKLFWLWIGLMNAWPDTTRNSGSRGLDSTRFQDIDDSPLLVGMTWYPVEALLTNLPLTNLLDYLWLSILFVKYTDQCLWMLQSNRFPSLGPLCTSVPATNWDISLKI